MSARSLKMPEFKAQLSLLIAASLTGTYHCTRTWAAWGVGTMTSADFCDVAESDTPAELAGEVLEFLRSMHDSASQASKFQALLQELHSAFEAQDPNWNPELYIQRVGAELAAQAAEPEPFTPEWFSAFDDELAEPLALPASAAAFGAELDGDALEQGEHA